MFIDYKLGVLPTYAKAVVNTRGTKGGPGGHDRTLAIKSRNQHFFHKKKITKKIAYIFQLCQNIRENKFFKCPNKFEWKFLVKI